MSGRILDDDALKDEFARNIRPWLRGASRGEQATVLLVTGQEASGKSSLMEPLAASLGLGGACRFEVDDLFTKHPEYGRLASGNDKDVELRLLDDINYLTYLAEAEIRKQGWDLVTSQPCYSERLAVAEVEYQHSHDYRVVVAVVATHPAESLLSVADRYYNHGGRRIPQEDHAESVDTLPRVVHGIAALDSCAALHFVTRDNAVPGPDFRGSPDAAQRELARLQDLPWTVEQVERFHRTRSLLPHDADPDLVREIDRLAEPKLNEFHTVRQREASLAAAVRASGIADTRNARPTSGESRGPVRSALNNLRNTWRGRD